jgi:FKBP-type peptidyl-prolyl cis-trans isomerase FkpA
MLISLLLAIAGPAQAAPASPPPPVVATASGLRFQTLKPGTGPRPTPADAVLIAYEGRLADGKVFDKSEQPVGMMVSGVIPGFQEALLLMSQGGTYRFWIPGMLAYGPEGTPDGTIPPNAELDFTVTLVDIGRPAPAPAPSPVEPPSAD